MTFQGYMRYVDALLLLSLKEREVNGEKVVTSTSCVSSSILSELKDMEYLGYAEKSGNYVISKKGRLVLNQVKQAPWGTMNINMSPPTVQT